MSSEGVRKRLGGVPVARFIELGNTSVRQMSFLPQISRDLFRPQPMRLLCDAIDSFSLRTQPQVDVAHACYMYYQIGAFIQQVFIQ